MFTRELRRLHLDVDVLDWLKTALRSSHEDERRLHHAAIDRLTKQYAALQRKLDVLYEDRLDGRRSVDRYEAKANAFREEMAHVRAELARHEKADRRYTEEGIALLELAGMALELYESQEASERRLMLDFLCLNTEFRGGSLAVQWRKPFDVLAESIEAKNTKGVAIDESSDAYQVWLPGLVDRGYLDLRDAVPADGAGRAGEGEGRTPGDGAGAVGAVASDARRGCLQEPGGAGARGGGDAGGGDAGVAIGDTALKALRGHGRYPFRQVVGPGIRDPCGPDRTLGAQGAHRIDLPDDVAAEYPRGRGAGGARDS